MNYQILDLETYKRKSHFEYFSQLAYPYVGVTADVEITEFRAKIKEQRSPGRKYRSRIPPADSGGADHSV